MPAKANSSVAAARRRKRSSGFEIGSIEAERQVDAEQQQQHTHSCVCNQPANPTWLSATPCDDHRTATMDTCRTRCRRQKGTRRKVVAVIPAVSSCAASPAKPEGLPPDDDNVRAARASTFDMFINRSMTGLNIPLFGTPIQPRQPHPA